MVNYFPIALLDHLHSKNPPNAPPGMGSALGDGEFYRNLVGRSSACRPGSDQLTDPIFALAALFAAQIEQTNSDYFRIETNTSKGHLWAKEASLS